MVKNQSAAYQLSGMERWLCEEGQNKIMEHLQQSYTGESDHSP